MISWESIKTLKSKLKKTFLKFMENNPKKFSDKIIPK